MAAPSCRWRSTQRVHDRREPAARYSPPGNSPGAAKPARKTSDGTLCNAFNPRARTAFSRTSERGTEVTGYIVAMEEETDLDCYTR
ncbi:hypothetical protein ABIA39_003418 [Nocardia sp. GAS34]|uniref:hypothetical protein n=1 Tax=unclassified Nocardia TaxID=2637762 RepID=UPI003D21D9A0